MPIMYWVIIAVLLLIAFFLRKRLLGLATVIQVLIGMIFFSILLVDIFWGHQIRQYLPGVVSETYDETIKDPVEMGNKALNTATDVAVGSNDKLIEVGSELDRQVGITVDESGNRVWSNPLKKNEPGTTENTESSEKDSDKTEEVKEEEGYLDKIKGWFSSFTDKEDEQPEKSSEAKEGNERNASEKEINNDAEEVAQVSATKSGKVPYGEPLTFEALATVIEDTTNELTESDREILAQASGLVNGKWEAETISFIKENTTVTIK